ncbi:MAG: hypothetical protein JW915_03275 [Chitinispirillaceae bacterium]|nr:hypothetical protein [Chitinispirillaceae bacterium]
MRIDEYSHVNQMHTHKDQFDYQQIQRYMGYVQEELIERKHIVKGIIMALEDDIRIRRALLVTKSGIEN